MMDLSKTRTFLDFCDSNEATCLSFFTLAISATRTPQIRGKQCSNRTKNIQPNGRVYQRLDRVPRMPSLRAFLVLCSPRCGQAVIDQRSEDEPP